MARLLRQVESTHGGIAPNGRVDCLRCLLNHPRVLAVDSSARRILEITATITVPDSAAGVDGNVGGRSRHHGALAQRPLVCKLLDLDSSGRSVLRGPYSLYAVAQPV